MISIGYKSLIILNNFERTTNCKQRTKEPNTINDLAVDEHKNTKKHYYEKKLNVFKDLVVVEVFSNVFNCLVVVVDPIVVVEVFFNVFNSLVVVVESAQGLALTERP